jgi:hypothetical protein
MVNGATPKSCTLAQRICLLFDDLPSASRQPDFVPEASYLVRYRPHARAWLAELDELAKEPALSSYVLIARTKIELADASEADRRLVVEQNAAAVLPKPGLPCSLPPP